MVKLNINNSKYCDINIRLIVSIIVFLVIFYTVDGDCSGLVQLTKTLKTKIDDITKVISSVAKAGVGIGVLWFIISLIRGEPHYRYAFLLVLSGCLLYTASNITQWAIGT